MPQRSLGSTGLDASIPGFGGAPLGSPGADDSSAARPPSSALDLGLHRIDPARGYYPAYFLRRVGVRAIATLCTVALVQPAPGQPLSVQFRNLHVLPTTALDQFSQAFTITGLSGISWICGDEFVAVMDNSNKLVVLNVTFAADGSIASASVPHGVSLSQIRDFEGIAYTDTRQQTVFLSEEGTPAVHEFIQPAGFFIRTLPTPPVFANRRSNLGFEALARHPIGTPLWTANEEALTVDGPTSSPTAGTVVRLLRYDAAGDTFEPGPQYAYVVDPWHGTAVSGARSGLVDLVILPDGRMLGLERSLAFNLNGFFQSRIYHIDVSSATDVSGLPGLSGASYTPVARTLLWSGFLQNVEGLTLGPALPNGDRVLLGIIDDGDPISSNNLVAWTLSGVGPLDPCPGARGDANCDGSIDFFDIDPFLTALFDLASYECGYCGRSICAVDVDCSGNVDFFDIDPFLLCLFDGCGSCP